MNALDRGRGLDLARAVSTLASAIPRPSVHVNASEFRIDDPEAAHVLLRCCQEVLTNAIKHAGASNLWIELERGERKIELNARDDGQGSVEVRVDHGLRGMRERVEAAGGRLDIDAGAGVGFAVRVTMPAPEVAG